MTDNGTAPGLHALEVLSDLLMIDAEWSIRQPRRVTWWPYGLAQHINAGNPVRFDDGHAGCMLRVWTDLVADVTDAAAAVGLAGVVNQQESMSAVVYDSERAVTSEAFTSLVFADTVESWATVMSLAAVMQATAAHSRAHAIADAVGGTAAVTSHPRRGERPEMDDLLDVPDRLSSPKGSAASSWNA